MLRVDRGWVQVLYSHPTLHAEGRRNGFAEPAGDAVWFAGEATHEGINPCIHGAMETGQRAAAAVCASLEDERRRGGSRCPASRL